ncbi:hypothetical protein AOQ84DRAFT_363520 [Glonium stellatum]|uniref:Uncharacterized protein n=1 Tax=Glonium stellatum TaxID=574774 RepID=A0A8E2F223_9PEZI|nr:hypothetical protein AOQ84DRAFT_363520 [Glonium stellatum]
MTIKNFLSIIGVFATVVYARAVPGHQHEFKPADIITRDIYIIGGGASGTYAAVRLREDMNTTIIMVEQKDHLRTGKAVPGYPSADPKTALKIYAGQVQKYPYLASGYFLPDPIPDDLLLI